MDSKEFLRSYLNDFSNLVKPNKDVVHKLVKVADLLKDVKAEGKKILIFGNGGSAAIASHFSVDLTKNASLRCINCNEADLITCFANDYGFERWVEKAVDFYGNEGDLLIVISSSGSSKNMLNGVKAARKGNFKAVVTLSGFAEDNPLRQLGDINLWINSRAYNFVENIHQVWLLAIVDLIIGSREYSA
ncbi:MAG TPA: SIS domain-containing protein [Candidatus Marinimicrobia bacterium]|jgi:D-sedoheptulose 7-phosphate isomerase|nr:SIS domain-containing protein [Candidatus Neomarinimicrobiota bacterium]